MARTERFFANLSECEAFKDGLEYVNDSSIRDIVVRRVYTEGVLKPWRVEFEDTDQDDLASVRAELEQLREEFDRAGGRGVELAERIDLLQDILNTEEGDE